MASPNHDSYKILADLIYAEKPELKPFINEAAMSAIRGARETLSDSMTDADLEIVFQMIAQVTATFLSSQAVDLSDRMNAAFNLYSLAAGSVAGALDLGDETPAKDKATIRREAEKAAQSRTDTVEPDINVAGPYL
jgi:hypothetical protein